MALSPSPVVEKRKKLNRLAGKVSIITGADSGIGKAIAFAYTRNHGAGHPPEWRGNN